MLINITKTSTSTPKERNKG